MNQSLTSSSTSNPVDGIGMNDEEEIRRAGLEAQGIGEILVDLNTDELRELGIE